MSLLAGSPVPAPAALSHLPLKTAMPQRPATVVLLHGLFGFHKLFWLEYFRNVCRLFDRMGIRVLAPRVAWAGAPGRRSTQLARHLTAEPGPLHLVGHSLGGIDARHYITHCGGHRHVASLTTIASPHRGSAAADHLCRSLSPLAVFAGVRFLQRERMARFNERTPDHPSVVYRSYSAARPVAELPWPLRGFGRLIQRTEGANDGQVSVSAAVWGEHVATLDADHLELIGRDLAPKGMRHPFDHLSLYREIGQWILAWAG